MTQAKSILTILQQARGAKVALPFLAAQAECLAVSERCSELRRGKIDGICHDIQNETSLVPGSRRKRSWYWLPVETENSP